MIFPRIRKIVLLPVFLTSNRERRPLVNKNAFRRKPFLHSTLISEATLGIYFSSSPALSITINVLGRFPAN